MHLTIYKPPLQLAGIVNYFWALESVPGTFTPPKYLALADSSPEMIFQFDGGFKEYATKSYLVAQRSVSRWRHLEKQVGMFGIRLYPHALKRITGISSDELNNKVYGLDDLFGNKGIELTEKVINAPSTKEKISIASSFLLDTISERDKTVEFIILYMIRHNGNISLDFLQSMTNISERQLQRKFKEYIGFPPKYLMRMLRFQGAKRDYVSGKFDSLTGLSYAYGYADQSHFCREFMEFANIPALQYKKLLTQSETEIGIMQRHAKAQDTLFDPAP